MGLISCRSTHRCIDAVPCDCASQPQRQMYRWNQFPLASTIFYSDINGILIHRTGGALQNISNSSPSKHARLRTRRACTGPCTL